ncbi:MAG: hypothetical protein PVF43_02160 [Candidatus Eiseniibacteriota bacterium]
MNDERWYDLIDRIRTQFGTVSATEEALETGPGKREVVEFESPMGRMRLERVTRPVVKEKRTHYSKRAGSATTEEYVYEEGEFTHRVSLFRWNGTDWQEEDYRGMWR